MSFTPTTLCRIAHGNGFTIWSYRTTDAQADVDTEDYFVNAINQINIGDVIFAISDTNTKFAILVCNENDGTTIDFANITNLAAADGD